MNAAQPGLRQRIGVAWIPAPHLPVRGTDVKSFAICGIRDPKNLFDIFSDLAKAFLALPQRRVAPLAPADIDKGNHDSGYFLTLENGRADILDGKARAVVSVKKLIGRLMPRSLSKRKQNGSRMIGKVAAVSARVAEDLVERFADGFLGLPPQERSGRRIYESHFPLAVQPVNALARRIQNQFALSERLLIEAPSNHAPDSRP